MRHPVGNHPVSSGQKGLLGTMGIKKSMTGAPWHVEMLHPNDQHKRHKAKCSWYGDGRCGYSLIPCPGSTHCEHYKETRSQNENVEPTPVESTHKGRSNTKRAKVKSKFDYSIPTGSQYTLYCIGEHHLRTVTIAPESAEDRFGSKDCISPESTFAKALAGRQVGDVITLKGSRYRIEKIFIQQSGR